MSRRRSGATGLRRTPLRGGRGQSAAPSSYYVRAESLRRAKLFGRSSSAPEERARAVLVAAPHDLPAVVAVDQFGLERERPGRLPRAAAAAGEERLGPQGRPLAVDGDVERVLVDLDAREQLARLAI